MRLSLQSRIFIIIGFITALTLSALWTVVRPRYETSVISERLTNVRQLQVYAIENLDRTIAGWSDVTKFITWHVSERPNEGEYVLRMMMSLHPDIVQIRIQSPKLTDELASQNTSYPAANIQIKDQSWVPSKIDTAMRVAWLNDSLQIHQFFVMQKRFMMQQIPFVLTVVWDAKQLRTILSNLPLGDKSSVSILAPSSTILRNDSFFHPELIPPSGEPPGSLRSVTQGNQVWRVLSSDFQTAQLWMIVAIPEHAILQPVHDLLLFSMYVIIGVAILAILIGWILALQVSRPIQRLVKDVRQLSNLDFSQTIHIPRMKDLRGIGETIEVMRQDLERYQRLNVEKIILEEWKNKLMMMHSDDMVGMSDGTGLFVFRNEKMEKFCSSLLPARSFQTKSDLLTHPSIAPVKETIRDDAADGLLIHFIQSEIKVEGESATAHSYRVNDLSITRDGESLGSLLIVNCM